MFKPADFYELKWIEDLQLSPDGRRAAFVVKQAAADGAGYTSAVWVASLEDGTQRPVSQGDRQAGAPRWSPDGSLLAFTSNRLDGRQLWLVPADGGAERQLTRLPGGAADAAWSPDGRRLAFVSRAPAADQGDDDEPIVGPRPTVRVIRRLKYKWDGKGWWDGRYAQIYLLPLDTLLPEPLTAGDWDHAAPAWSPDGRWIAFVADRSLEADWHRHQDIWLLPAAGGDGGRGRGEPVKLTSSLGPVVRPHWSPDGSLIAYLGHDNRYERQTCMGLYVVPAGPAAPVAVAAAVAAAGARERNVLEGFDYPATGMVTGGLVGHRSGCAPAFTREGDLLFISTISGSQQVQRVPLEGGRPEALTAPGSVVYDMSYSRATGQLAFLASDPKTVSDLYLIPALGERPRRLTEVNREFLAARRVSLPERFAYPGSFGEEVESWLYKPAGFDAGRKYPLVLFIHGGSSPCHGYAFNLDFQVLASDGFVVWAPNERGSQGYGQARSASVKHVWCGPDYEDLMTGTDRLVELPYVDGARLGVTGGSYGGLMTNWIVTHTDRFAAAVTQRSTSNRYSNWGTCDEGIHISEYIYPCDPWEDPKFYMDRSPAVYVERVKTPLLILHSDQDFRCNLEQAEQFYRALKRLRKPVEMVIFLGESHELSRSGRPANRVERMRQIRRWFRKYLKG